MLSQLRQLSQREPLSRPDAFTVAQSILSQEVPIEQATAALIALNMKGETVDEISGFADAALAQAIPFPHAIDGLVDTCGTGGDGSGSFNISTAAALLLASGGVKIAKHGNRSSSSRSGSADVLAALGIPCDLSPEDSLRQLEANGFCFLFAPKYLPGFAGVKDLRKNLGIPTIFNLLGPLLNPARVKRQVLGVNKLSLVVPFAEILKKRGAEEAFVIHGRDDNDETASFDEVSVSGITYVAHLKEGLVRTYYLRPEDFGIAVSPQTALAGGDAKDNANIIERIFDGTDQGPKRDVVVANAALGFMVAGAVSSIQEGVSLAHLCLDLGRAGDLLATLRGGL